MNGIYLPGWILEQFMLENDLNEVIEKDVYSW